MILIIGRIFEYTERITDPDDFAADYKTVDATLMNFVALGETANKLSDRFREKHNNIEWRKIYDFRNIIAHDYFGIDEEEVLGITKKHLPILKKDLTDLLDSYIL
ncbi:MAG: DUF86 domain-containing protein [Bacteroidetes bacterium]|nr:DUF86 domain-containing protein [Bacteroidota bacterium]